MRDASCPATAEIETLVPSRLSDDVHQGAHGELREVADEGEKVIVVLRRENLRNGAEPGRKCFQLIERLGIDTFVGSEKPRASAEHIGARVIDATASGAAQRMAADECKSIWQRRGSLDDRALRAAGVGDDSRSRDVVG